MIGLSENVLIVTQHIGGGSCELVKLHAARKEGEADTDSTDTKLLG